MLYKFSAQILEEIAQSIKYKNSRLSFSSRTLLKSTLKLQTEVFLKSIPHLNQLNFDDQVSELKATSHISSICPGLDSLANVGLTSKANHQ